MDNTIIEMFKEKNDKILFEKLLLDLDNNNDSLRLTINNKIKLVLHIKFLKKINKILKSSEIKYDVKTLDEIIDEVTNIIEEKVKCFLNIRKEKISYEISNNFTNIDDLYDFIDQNEVFLKQEIEKQINLVVYEQLENKLFDLYKFKTEDQKNEISSNLKRLDSELTLNILTPLSERNCSLKNMVRETQDKVTDLNLQTTRMIVNTGEGKIIKKSA